MVIWYKILNVVLIINLKYFVVALPNIVIVNNKPMTYDRKEDFAEIITVIEDGNSVKEKNSYEIDLKSSNKQENVKQKSNIFKTSNFVTNNNFRAGLITKHNFTLHLPVKIDDDRNSNKYENSKFSSNFHHPTLITARKNYTITTTTPAPPFILEPEIVSAIIYNNDIISIANSLNHSSGNIQKHDNHKKRPSIIKKAPVIKENPVIIVHSTPSTPTIVTPIFLSSPTKVKTTKTKKKKDNSSKISMHESNFHDHLIQNLDYYRKLLKINCTNGAKGKNSTYTQPIVSDIEFDTVEITPKPGSKQNDKYEYDKHKDKDKDKDKDDKDKKCKCDKDKKCKKKHHHHHGDHHHDHHHHGHHHHHKGSKESHEDEYKPSYDYKPAAFQQPVQAPQEAHTLTGIPTTYSHLHQHKLQIQSPDIINPINRVTPLASIPAVPNKIDYFAAPEKLPPLGDDYEEVGNMFDTFYRAVENFAFTSNDKVDQEEESESAEYESREYESVDASDDYSESKSEDIHDDDDEDEDEDDDYEENYSEKRRKRRDLSERENIMPRKSLKTKIIITNEYDDSVQPNVDVNVERNQTSRVTTLGLKKKQRKGKRKKDNRSKSSEEYDDIIEDIMSFRDDFDDSYSDEYYYEDLSLSNRRTNGSKRILKGKVINIKKHKRDESPTNFITDGLRGMFSYIENIFPAFFGNSLVKDTEKASLRKSKNKQERKKRNNYDGEMYLKATVETTEKPESQSKRPKRENEKLPWYFPSFLSSHDTHNDAGSTEQLSSTVKKWHLPWNGSNNEGVAEKEASPQETTIKRMDEMDETTAKALPYDFFGMISQMLTTRKKQSKSIISRRIRKKGYTNYQLWRLFPMTKDDVTYLNEFRMSTDGNKIHWLKRPNVKDTIDVVIPPSYVDTFENFLTEGEIKYVVKIRNIQHAIKFENPRLNKRDQIELELINGHPVTWYRYHSFRDIQTYYDYLKRKYPTFVELLQIGWSFNGKPLTVVKVSYPMQTLYDMKKPAIFILAGTSAHIWLPTACSTYILNSLVTNIANNDNYGKMIRKFDWYVLSLLNPDGYDYAMTVDRLWQKTRSRQFVSNENFISSAMNWFRISNSTEKVCYGVDMTRNFDSNWVEEDESSGDNKCSDHYEGPHASSEPEIKLLSNFLLKHNKSIKLFINLDGYGQQISFPSAKLKQDALDELNDMARSGLRNMKMHRNSEKKYDINSRNAIMSSGTVESFAMHKAKIKYTYRIESMDNRQYSIFVPATSIEQNANEILDIMRGMVKYLENE